MSNVPDLWLDGDPDYTPTDPIKTQQQRLDRRRAAALALITKAQQPNRDQMVGGGRTTSFGDRPGILVPGNTAATALGNLITSGMGAYENAQTDKAQSALDTDKQAQFDTWMSSNPAAPKSVGGASSNLTDVPMQADPNTVRANLERGMDPQLANATGVPDSALQPAVEPKPKMNREQWLLSGLQQFPEQRAAITQMLTAEGYTQRDQAQQPMKLELAQMRLDQAAQQAASRATSQQELAAIKQQYALELVQLRQGFTAEQNAMYRRTAADLNSPKPQSAVKPPSGYQWNPDGSGSLVAIPGGPATKPTAAQVAGMADAVTGVNQIDRAWAEVDKNPDALGLKNYFPDFVMQRADPSGVNARAAITNLGSQIIHDRSGAAVTISETPRLLPFIPQKTDTPDAAKKKLTMLRKEMETAGMSFAPPSVADSLKQTLAPKPTAPKPTAQGTRPGTERKGNDGRTYVYDGKGWKAK